MSADLTDLLGSDMPPVACTGRQLLAAYRRSWPLNGAALKPAEPPDRRSLRVRLRSVEQHLRDQGFVVSGFEPSRQIKNADYEIGVRAELDRSGEPKDDAALKLVVTEHARDPDGARKTFQQALHHEGLVVVVTMDGSLHPVFAGQLPLSAESLQWMELGRSGYHGISAEQYADFVAANAVFLGSWEPVEWLKAGHDARTAAAWAAASGRLRYHRSARPWLNAQISPAEAGVWMTCGMSYDDRLWWLSDGLTLDDAVDFAAVNSTLASVTQARRRARHLVQICDADDRRRLRQLHGTSGLRIVGRVVEGMRGAAALKCALDWAEMLCAADGSAVPPLSEIDEWVSDCVAPGDVERWRELRAAWQLTRAATTAWIRSGLSPQQARRWGDAHELLRDAQVVAGWVADDLDVEDALPWARAWEQIRGRWQRAMYASAVEIHRRSVVRAWLDVDARCADPQLVVRLILADLSPDRVRSARELLPRS